MRQLSVFPSERHAHTVRRSMGPRQTGGAYGRDQVATPGGSHLAGGGNRDDALFPRRRDRAASEAKAPHDQPTDLVVAPRHPRHLRRCRAAARLPARYVCRNSPRDQHHTHPFGWRKGRFNSSCFGPAPNASAERNSASAPRVECSSVDLARQTPHGNSTRSVQVLGRAGGSISNSRQCAFGARRTAHYCDGCTRRCRDYCG